MPRTTKSKSQPTKLLRGYAEKDGCIGNIFYWKFKDAYLFINHEESRVEMVHDLSKIQIFEYEHYQKLFVQRNKFVGNERQQRYGTLHESMLEMIGTSVSSPEGLWTYDFCREVAFFKSMLGFKKVLNQEGVFDYDDYDKNTQHKYAGEMFVGTGSVYEDTCKQMFNEEIPEDEIKQIIKNYFVIPEDWRKFGYQSEEMQHYIELLNPDISVEQDPDREKKLLESLEEPSIKEKMVDDPEINLQKLEEFLDRRVLNYTQQIESYKKIVKAMRDVIGNGTTKYTQKDLEQYEEELVEVQKNILLLKFMRKEVKKAPDKMVKVKEFFNIK